ncbi:MAG TPA: CYTH and CHAD domain-containing protein, partial [Burkholderiaceae bacterium]|nr:CYTH and CHAD domain-containing protein [Burkholderiaceae bacterium]
MKTEESTAHHGPPHGHAAKSDSAPRAPDGAERELKFGVPDANWVALSREMSGADSRLDLLHAIYQDVPDRSLARASVALRVRRERGQWIQTLKAPGAHALERVEDEVVIGPARDGKRPPTADLKRHKSSAAHAALRDALGLKQDDPWPKVQPAFEVKVQRRVRQVMEGESRIELALDEGEVLAAGRKQPIRELELELVEGDVRDLLALARRWRERWGLWLSTASKAARGDRLVSGELYGPAVAAAALQLRAKPRMGEFTAAVLHECMAQVAGNASEIAAGSQADEHVHQVRVGLRRLRTALRELPGLSGARESFEPVLVRVFQALGERRDRTHVLRTIAPQVEAAGGPPLRVPPGFHEGADAG